MLDFDKLDKNKTYCGLHYGKSLLSKEIRKFSKEYAPNSANIPTHVLGLKYRFNSWWIYESHIVGNKKYHIPSGVSHHRADIWLQIENPEEFNAYPLDLNEELLEEYIGYGYGTGDIKELMKASIFHTNGKQKDREGIICSEYIALCNTDICKYYNLPPYCITPAHFQNYFDSQNIKPVE